MNKKVIVIIICVMLGLVLGVVLSVNNESNDREDLESYSKIYDENGNVINVMQGTLIQKEVIETISNTKIQGIVESSHNEYIYIFNGQHFGEYGFEMKEYTRANIDNRKQECIDYYTSEKYDTSYIQDGDLIFCTGDLKKYSTGDDDFDTKDNPIIVLKEKDYNNLKRKTISNAKTGTITVGEYFGKAIKEKAKLLYKRINWKWYTNENTGYFYMGYSPEKGFFGSWDMYAEQLMLYVLGVASPTFPTTKDMYYNFKREKANYKHIQNIIYTYCGTLFTYQFSHAWIDFRNTEDANGIDWFENSIKATKANRQYCIDNSLVYKTFNKNSWGLTACLGPNRIFWRFWCYAL